MKYIIQSLLITGTIIGSQVNAAQPSRPMNVAPHRPSSQPPRPHDEAPMHSSDDLKKDNTICPDILTMPQLREIQNGTLKLGKFKFELSSPKNKNEFDEMLPNKAQKLSEAKSVAKIDANGRALIGIPLKGRALKCTYTFRTAIKSVVGGEHKKFSILSEPTQIANEPKGLAEAIENAPITSHQPHVAHEQKTLVEAK